MWNIWRKDLKQTLKSPLALFSYLALLAGFLGGAYPKISYIFLLKQQAAHPVPGINAEAAREFLSAANGYVIFQEGMDDLYLPLAIVVVVGLLFSARFLYEKNTGFGNFVLTRRKFDSYFMQKCAVAFWGAFLFVCLSLLTFLLFALLIFSFQTPTHLFWGSSHEFALMELFERSPFLFALISILNLSLFAGLFSLFGMGMSLLTSNRFLVSVSPTALFLCCILFPQLFPDGTRGVRWMFIPNLVFFFGQGGAVGDVAPPLLRYGVLLLLFSSVALAPVIVLYCNNRKNYLK